MRIGLGKSWALPALMVLVACSRSAPMDQSLSGLWQQRILVPTALQGRCVDEVVQLDASEHLWRSKVVVHSSFACNQPYYSVTFEGTLASARGGPERTRFSVSNIHVTAVADINQGKYDYLGASGVNSIQKSLIGTEPARAEFSVRLSDGDLHATVFRPVLQFVAENYPHMESRHVYQRLTRE